jgi:impB/mucB/samB family/SOS response associated peptidase (SRAP)
VSLNNYPIPALSLRWLYVDFNSYFASVEQQLRPELRGKPVAVVPVETDSTCAIAASYEAKAFGVKTGTPIYEAKRLCPGLICVLARHERYVEFHHRLIEEIEQHIPITAVCSIDEVACRLMDNEISVERSTEIAQSIKNGIAKNIGPYMRCSIGIAPNRYLAKVGTELQKPDGLVVLRAEDLPKRLFSLKLRDLPGVGANIERRIQTAGITNLPSLFALNPLFAGLYESWYPEPNWPQLTFTIVTCPANALIGSIHDRMPVVLDEGGAEDWMNPHEPNPASLKRLLVPAPEGALEMRPASPLANSVRNDGPELLG